MRLRRTPVTKDGIIEKSGGGIAAKKPGHRLMGSVRRPIHFVKDFAEVYEIIVFLA